MSFNAAPNVQRVMAQNMGVTLNVVTSAQKKNKLKLNQLMKTTSKSITQTKLTTFDAEYYNLHTNFHK